MSNENKVSAPDERASFEAWADARKEDSIYLPKFSDGTYIYDDTHAAWEAWQARAALAATPAATPVVLPEPDAWLAVYEDREGNSKFYTSTHKDLAVENDTNGKPQPLYTEQQVRALLATGGQAQAVQPITGPCGQCKSSIQPCDCAISTILKERGLVAVDATHYSKVSAQAKAAAPQAQADARDAEIQQAVLAERERICAAIKAEDDHCVTEGDYMLDSDDCIKVARGEWVRPVYDAAIAAAKGELWQATTSR